MAFKRFDWTSDSYSKELDEFKERFSLYLGSDCYNHKVVQVVCACGFVVRKLKPRVDFLISLIKA